MIYFNRLSWFLRALINSVCWSISPDFATMAQFADTYRIIITQPVVAKIENMY